MSATKQKLWIGLFALALSLASALSQAALADVGSQKDPQPALAEAINELIDRLQKNADQIKTDSTIAYQISDELIAPRIDFPRVTRLVIGKHWHSASAAQRQQLVEEIRSLLIRSYVTAMTSYADKIVAQKDRISYLPSRYVPGDNKASVRVNISMDNGQAVEVQYQLYINKDDWKIYDIRIEGISLAISYRTSFGEQIQRDGLDSLITQLAERNRKGEVELPASASEPFAGKTSAH